MGLALKVRYGRLEVAAVAAAENRKLKEVTTARPSALLARSTAEEPASAKEQECVGWVLSGMPMGTAGGPVEEDPRSPIALYCWAVAHRDALAVYPALKASGPEVRRELVEIASLGRALAATTSDERLAQGADGAVAARLDVLPGHERSDTSRLQSAVLGQSGKNVSGAIRQRAAAAGANE